MSCATGSVSWITYNLEAVEANATGLDPEAVHDLTTLLDGIVACPYCWRIYLIDG
jgi:hypothetical protein